MMSARFYNLHIIQKVRDSVSFSVFCIVFLMYIIFYKNEIELIQWQNDRETILMSRLSHYKYSTFTRAYADGCKP